MQKIPKMNSQYQESIKIIKKDFDELLKIEKSKNQNFNQIKNTIKKIHEDLNNLEKNYKNTSNSTDKIKKRIVVKNKSKSKSFSSWMFNNKEL